MERMYLVCYDISDQKRWRKVYTTMKGYGAWLQLSVFQCRLRKTDLLIMTDLLEETINHQEDSLLVIDLGPAEKIAPKVTSYGKPFHPLQRGAVVI